MASMIKLTGLKTVLSNLKKATRNISQGASRGLVKGGQFLQGESMKIVPVQFGNLRGSAFTRRMALFHVIVGYTASYAAFVHENPDAAHGKDFNIKHADKIAGANATLKFNPAGQVIGQKAGTTRHRIWFNRGERQQWKFLEKPVRDKRAEILQIIATEARK